LNKRAFKDILGQFLSWLSSSLTIALCFGIIVYIFIKGFSQISPSFIFSQPNPTFKEELSGGISTPIIGTLILTTIGILFAFPWALSTSIYLSEYSQRNPLAKYFRLGIDVLAGVPTIVIAIFGLAIFSNPAFGFLSSMVEGIVGVNRAFGRSFFVSGLTMAVMILPFIIKTCEEAIKAVPESYREGSLAMGASKWHTITKIVLPSARNGIITGVVLGMGRIIGDTAIVMLTLGATLRMTGLQPWWAPQNWISTLRNTGSTLTSYIYFTSPAGEGNMTGKAFGASVVLIVIIILLNLFTDLLGNLNKTVKEE
jgi:phosphate transport system permease protein